MREKLDAVISEVLQPLLERDESGITLISTSEDEVVVEVSGRAAFGVGAEYVRTGVIEPALRKVIGDDIKLRINKAIPKPKKRTS